MKGFDLFKTCTGPAHAGPTRLPLTSEHWAFYRSGERAGKPVGRCKACYHWNVLLVKDGPHGLVPVAQILPWVTELVRRCGSFYETAQRHDLIENTLRNIASGKTRTVRKATAFRVLTALGEQRKIDRRNGSSPSFLAAKRAQVANEQRMNLLAGY